MKDWITAVGWGLVVAIVAVTVWSALSSNIPVQGEVETPKECVEYSKDGSYCFRETLD